MTKWVGTRLVGAKRDAATHLEKPKTKLGHVKAIFVVDRFKDLTYHSTLESNSHSPPSSASTGQPLSNIYDNNDFGVVHVLN
jgi:hypothetical protein